MKKGLKIFGYVFGGIMLLLLLVAMYVQRSGIPEYELPEVDFRVRMDSASIAEGKRISDMVCNDCHRSANGLLEGNLMFGGDNPSPFGTVYAPNITSDKTYGVGRYSDAELAILLRTGIKRDGQYAPPWMPKFPHLSDEDLNAIIAYLRSDAPELAPSAKVQPPNEPSFLAKLLSRVAFKPLPYPETPIKSPDPANVVAFGEYLCTAKVECYSCHSLDFAKVDMMHPEKTTGYFGGGNPFEEGDQIIYSANLTMDEETGLGHWTEADFIRAVRYGIGKNDQPLRQPMKPFSGLTEDEVRAIWAYLQTVPKIHNPVERQGTQ
ncbi:MAG: cytochrome c [Lewinellaceae bacterium]|nr:cytochrome c [Lewinellaceae bacterium]HPQ98565.1 c-type cytochrome [Saprospiraceae bacterium]